MNVHPIDCQKCKLCETSNNVVPSIIIPQSRVMLIGEAPGKEEDEKGIPFIGDAGKVLNDALRDAAISRDHISISNICACRPPENRPPQPKEIEACFEFLDAEIKELKPELLVLLGNTPLKTFLKGVGGITKVRGKWFDSEEYNCKIFPTFHPAYILRNPQERTKLVNDLKQVKNFLDGKVFNDEKSPVDYKVAYNLTQFDWIIDQLNLQEEWSFDTETTGLDFEKDDIFIFTFSWLENTAVLIDLRYFEKEKEYVWKRMKEVFENNSKKIPQNGSFDIEFLLSKGIVVQNYYCDTILMDYVLDENSRHGLEVLSEKYTDMGLYDQPLQQYKLQNKIDSYLDIPIEIMHPYALMDADCTFRSYKVMLPKIYEEGLDFVLFNIMMPMQKILIQTEYQGVSIDIPYLEKTIIKYEKQIEEFLNKSLQAPQVKEYIEIKKQEIIQKIKVKWESSKTLTKRFPVFDDYIKNQSSEKLEFAFNINSSKQLKELLIDGMKLPILKKTPKGGASLDDEVLEEYAKKNKFCEYLAKYRSLSHLKSTFLDGIKTRLEGDKIHTDYLLFSTVTGRPSSRDPNLNNIPRTGTAEDIKDIFCSDKYSDGSSDWLIEVDQGQAEFRLWINYSKDPQALHDLNEGIDIHKLMAAAAYGGKVLPKGNITHAEVIELTKDVKKAERQDTKLIIFGIMYGRGAKSVAEQLGVSIQLAQRIINLFFDRYKVAKKWIQINIALARRDGYVTSIFGRKRRLLNIKHPQDGIRAEAERQAINCLKKNTLVYTTRGTIPIEEVKKGDDVYNLSTTAKVLESRESLNKKEVVKVTFENNNFLELSEDHEIFILSKDGKSLKSTPVYNLKEGDYVATSLHRKDCTSKNLVKIDFKYPYKSSKIHKKHWIKEYTIPDVLSSDLSEFIGILIGDGCMNFSENSFQISIGKNFPEFQDHCVCLLRKLFNYNAKIVEDISFVNNKKFINSSIVINSLKIKKFLHSIGVKGTFKNKRIPKGIFESPVDVKLSCIKGMMDTDGSYSDSDISYCCYSLDLAQDFQNLLMSVGVNSIISIFKVKRRDSNYCEVSIRGKENRIKFLQRMSSSLQHKQITINSLLKKSLKNKKGFMKRAPSPILEAYLHTFSNYTSSSMQQDFSLLKKGEMSLFTLRKRVKEYALKVFDTLNYEYSTISKIEYTNTYEKMWDICVDSKDSLFIVKGICVHNSPIQSAASDLTFLACIEAFKVIRQNHLRSRLVLTVYDSLIFNVPDEELEFVCKLIFEKMEERPIPEIIVPLVPEIKVGKNWGGLMEIHLQDEWSSIKQKLEETFINN